MSEEKDSKNITDFTTFVFQESSDSGEYKDIRVHLDDDNQPWFVVRDISQALELNKETGTTTLVERIPEDFEHYLTLGKAEDTQGRSRETYMVAEPGLYYLILTSRAPKAFAMCRWVCEDVLPSIRSTGQYSVVGESDKVPESFADLQKTIHNLHHELASGIFEVVARSKKERESIQTTVDQTKELVLDMRRTAANNDKSLIADQKALIEGQQSLARMIHDSAIPVAEAEKKSKVKKSSKDEYFTQEEKAYYDYLYDELLKHMGAGKAQISAHINTCWRRKYGYRAESSAEYSTKGMNIFGIVAKEHYLGVKYSTGDATEDEVFERLQINPSDTRPHQSKLLELMEEELSMETGEVYSIENLNTALASN